MLSTSKIADSSALKSSLGVQMFPHYLIALLKGFSIINLNHITYIFTFWAKFCLQMNTTSSLTSPEFCARRSASSLLKDKAFVLTKIMEKAFISFQKHPRVRASTLSLYPRSQTRKSTSLVLIIATAPMAQIQNIFISKRVCVSSTYRSANQQFLQLILHLPESHFTWPWKQTAEWEEQRWEPLHPQPQNHTSAIRPMTLITHFGPELDLPCCGQTQGRHSSPVHSQNHTSPFQKQVCYE